MHHPWSNRFLFQLCVIDRGHPHALVRRIEAPHMEYKEMLDRRLRWIANAREVARTCCLPFLLSPLCFALGPWG